MPKENNCRCVVCEVERGLLNSLSTQIARTQFQALALNHPILNHFDSPADVIAQLHDHEQVELVNHKAWNGILHALVDSIVDRTAEEIGQQLLLLAYMPAIHRAYVEVCQAFPALAAEDVAQQAALVLLEAARSPAMRDQNGYLPIALARDFHKRLFRWAFGETRQSALSEEVSAVHPELRSAENFEDAVLLEDFLSQLQRTGVLSQENCDLLRKFTLEGFEASELKDPNAGNTTNAVQMRLKRIVKRLRDAIREGQIDLGRSRCGQSKHSSTQATIFSESVPISNSEGEKGCSPELTHPGPQSEPDVPPIAA